ncbi:MAG: hypothetical protein V8S42_01850 [Lachnospiraceae bacterium]
MDVASLYDSDDGRGAAEHDQSMYESAVLDGANLWQKNRYITIPSLRKIMAPAVIMTTFITFKQFDIIYLLTMQKGSVTGATLQTIITYAHQNAFVSNNYGLSSAVIHDHFYHHYPVFLLDKQDTEGGKGMKRSVKRTLGLAALNYFSSVSA